MCLGWEAEKRHETKQREKTLAASLWSTVTKTKRWKRRGCTRHPYIFENPPGLTRGKRGTRGVRGSEGPGQPLSCSSRKKRGKLDDVTLDRNPVERGHPASRGKLKAGQGRRRDMAAVLSPKTRHRKEKEKLHLSKRKGKDGYAVSGLRGEWRGGPMRPCRGSYAAFHLGQVDPEYMGQGRPGDSAFLKNTSGVGKEVG